MGLLSYFRKDQGKGYSLNAVIAISISFAIGVSLVADSTIQWYTERKFVERRIHEFAVNNTKTLILLTENLDSLDIIQRAITSLAAQRAVEEIHIVDRSRKVLASSRAKWIGEALPEASLPVAIKQQINRLGEPTLNDTYLLMPDGVYWAVVQVESLGLASGHNLHEKAAIIAKFETSSLRANYSQHGYLYYAASSASLLFCALLMLLLLRRNILSPLSHIIRAIRLRADPSAKAFIKISGRGEIYKLAESLDQLFESFDQNLLMVQKQQEQLMQSAKLSALGEMSAGIAHEINNPLAIISGRVFNLKQLLLSAGLPNADRLIQETDKLNATIERIAKIVKGLRLFSRSGGKADAMVPTPLQDIITDTLAFCGERLRFHGVELRLNVPQHIVIQCQPTQISQVFLNLINNAYDAIEELPEKFIEIDARIVADRVRISVTDSGHGIPKEILDKIMQPFFTTKPVGQGTGLGLSLSKGIIEEHQGTFSYDAECAHTRFVIELPIAK